MNLKSFYQHTQIGVTLLFICAVSARYIFLELDASTRQIKIYQLTKSYNELVQTRSQIASIERRLGRCETAIAAMDPRPDLVEQAKEASDAISLMLAIYEQPKSDFRYINLLDGRDFCDDSYKHFRQAATIVDALEKELGTRLDLGQLKP